MCRYEVELAMNASINASGASMVVAATPAIARTTLSERSVGIDADTSASRRSFESRD
jgi:hypothetical protein